MNFDADALRRQIPYYLTADPRQKELLNNLKALSEGANTGYFIPKGRDPFAAELLQGDGLASLKVFSFATGEVRRARGIILSNSCDIAPENKRSAPSKITFAPLVRLASIERRARQHSINNEQVENQLRSIRSQSTTNILYLPPDGVLDEEYVVLLDDVHSMPPDALAPDKLFTLSMAGFYLFLFKLSVHFCRLHEQVDRSPA